MFVQPFYSIRQYSVSMTIMTLGLMVSVLSNAQPGWVDFTNYYYYNILDDKGEEIVFKGNKSYQIIIDSLTFSGNNIPQDDLKPAIENQTDHFDNYISINDFAYRTPQSGFHTEIRVVHKKDTMALNQSAGNKYGYHSEKTQLQPKTAFHSRLLLLSRFYRICI